MQRDKLYSLILDLVETIRNRNLTSRLFFISVLPRVVDNMEAKPFLIKFNRWLAAIVSEVNTIFDKIKFLPVYLKFLDGVQPQLLLSEVGVALFKQVIFQLAGFMKNE